MTTDVDELLRIARETIGKLRFCVAVTLDGTGGTSARVMEPGRLDDDWRTGFLTWRGSRKVREIERNGQLALVYQYDPDGAYVTLHGATKIIGDVDAKRSVWTAESDRWFPNGPEDPEVVLVELHAQRIELWSAAHKVWPGISAAMLTRDGAGWSYGTT